MKKMIISDVAKHGDIILSGFNQWCWNKDSNQTTRFNILSSLSNVINATTVRNQGKNVHARHLLYEKNCAWLCTATALITFAFDCMGPSILSNYDDIKFHVNQNKIKPSKSIICEIYDQKTCIMLLFCLWKKSWFSILWHKIVELLWK